MTRDELQRRVNHLPSVTELHDCTERDLHALKLLLREYVSKVDGVATQKHLARIYGED